VIGSNLTKEGRGSRKFITKKLLWKSGGAKTWQMIESVMKQARETLVRKGRGHFPLNLRAVASPPQRDLACQNFNFKSLVCPSCVTKQSELVGSEKL